MCIELLALYLAVIILIGDVYRTSRVVFGCVHLDWRRVSNCSCCIWLCLFGLALCIELPVISFSCVVFGLAMCIDLLVLYLAVFI